MPDRWSSAPRNMLPPPTTTATWIPRRTTVAIWRANDWTTFGSTPTAPPPNTSPESLSTTRRVLGWPSIVVRVVAVHSTVFVITGTPPTCSLCCRWRSSLQAGYGEGAAAVRCRTPDGPLAANCGSGLAHLEPDEPAHRNASLLQNLLDGLLLVGHRRLLDEDEVLEEGVHPTLDDLRQGGLGLALLAGGLLGDVPLVRHHVGGHLVTRDVLRAHRRDLHRDPARVVDARLVLLAAELDGDAHLRRQVGALAVQVHRDVAVKRGDPVDHELLADAGRLRLDDRGDGASVAVRGREQPVHIGRALGVDDLDEALGQRHEVGVLGDEVGLAVQFEKRITGVGHQTVGGGTPGALADVLGALDTQDFDGPVEVALGLVEGLLTVHHAGAGEVAELLDVRGCEVGHDSLSL